ncbi:MAG: hypothetical protein MR717_09015 [Prevotella sp.]|nr:hypothetical protein [Prevotella sp.]
MKKIILFAVVIMAYVAVCDCAVKESEMRMGVMDLRDDAVTVDTSTVEYRNTAGLFYLCVTSDLLGAMPYEIAEIAVKEVPTIGEMERVIYWAMEDDCFYDTLGETDEYCDWVEMKED